MGRLVRYTAATLLAGSLSSSATRADLIATGTIRDERVGPDSYTYSMTLTVDPASTENVASFWFAWIPLYDFLPSHATAVGSPDGWTGYDTPDVYGVASGLWSTYTNPIVPGQSLSGFTWTTSDPPSVVYGSTADAFPELDGLPVLTSYVYRFPEARGDYEAFVPTVTTAVPEPASVASGAAAAAVLLRRRRHHL